MENLLSKSNLRSLDESGRPLTAGRSSLNPSGSDAFEGHLERAREDTRASDRDASRRAGEERVSKRDERETQRARRDAESERAEESKGGVEADRVRTDEGSARRDEDVKGYADTPAGEAETQKQSDADAQPEEQGQGNPALAPAAASPLLKPELAPGLHAEPASASSPMQAGAGEGILGMQEAPGAAQAAVGETQARPAQANSASPVQAAGAGEAQRAPEAKTAQPVAQRPEVEAQRPAVDAERIARAESVLQQIRVRFQPGASSATLALHPAELGRMRIQVEVEAGSVRAELRVESPEALAALERHIPELRALFASDGVELAEVDLGLARPDSWDQPAESRSDRRSGQPDDAAGTATDNDEGLAPPDALNQALAQDAGVDFLA